MHTTRRAVLTLLSGGGAISALYGADAWTKDPAGWDEKDIAKLLSDSPWAQRVDVALGGGGGMGGRGMGGGGVSDDPTGQLSGPGGGPGGGMGGGGRRGGGMGGGEGMQSLTFTVRWMSALPLKQAVVRSRMGKEADASAQAKEYLERTETHYVVALVGPSRGPGMGGGDGGPDRMQRMTGHLKEATGLLRKGKQPIRPETVQVPQAGQNNYLFLFPKAEAITLDDKEVEFVTRLGPMEIKRKFKLKDMVYQGQLAL